MGSPGTIGQVTRGVKKTGESRNFGWSHVVSLNLLRLGLAELAEHRDCTMDDNLFIAGAGQGETDKTLDSTSFAYQGHLWDNRLVPTIGTTL